MDTFHCIAADDARRLMADTAITIVDIRDPASHAGGRIPGAVHLSDRNLQAFLDSADMDRPLLVYCYHGISSQNAAGFFAERGFSTVYSLDGGFEGWRHAGPVES